MLKANPLKLTTMHKLFSDRGIGFVALENGQISIIDENFRKPQKIADFNKKNAKIRDIKMFKTTPLLLESIQCP